MRMVESVLAGVNVARPAEEDRIAAEPMVLLHGIGHRWQAFTPVLAEVAEAYDLYALDLPGFGGSEALARPEIGSMADRLEQALDALGLATAHLAGNSLGGWLALELTRRGRARSVTGVAPAGLWPGATPRQIKPLLDAMHASAKNDRLAESLRSPLVRNLALRTINAKPSLVPAGMAVGDAHNMADSPGMKPTLQGLQGQRFTGGRDIAVPLTIVFCGKDPLIRPKQSTLTELPAQTRVVRVPGVGHTPMWDAPGVIAALITSTAARASKVTSR